ncbi:MAG: hypothetical protein KDA57_04960 [Planctomycetales bacterium]|nr:hypothetical protein [Planctomycetales bacterium]
MTPATLISPQTSRRLAVLYTVSVIVLAVGAAMEPLRIWSNLLLLGFYLVTVGLGGALFIALTYVCGASWSVGFRRIPEALAVLLAPAAIGLGIILAVGREHYAWHAHGHGDAGTFWFKELWADTSFWLIRAVIYFAVWILLSRALVAVSRSQDQSGSVRLSHFNKRLSAFFLVIYAITFSLASFDWLMLLEPMWFSTIWGVYNFAGMVQATLATMIIAGILLRRRGPLQGVFSDDHLHDLGKLLLGFSCFWMYIWFSQYMLIWYTNMPEETSYFIPRAEGAWAPLMVANLVLNWIVPFLVLLPRPCKRSESVMMKVAVVVLVGRWLDLYLMIFPSTVGSPPALGIWEVAGMGLLVGALGWLFIRSFTRAEPIPSGDPLLAESLHYHC